MVNTCIKEHFIRQMLDIYLSIVWLDVDSYMHQFPLMLMTFSEDLLLRPHSTVPGRAWLVSVMGWNHLSDESTLQRLDKSGGYVWWYG